jgi:hypothetical protein
MHRNHLHYNIWFEHLWSPRTQGISWSIIRYSVMRFKLVGAKLKIYCHLISLHTVITLLILWSCSLIPSSSPWCDSETLRSRGMNHDDIPTMLNKHPGWDHPWPPRHKGSLLSIETAGDAQTSQVLAAGPVGLVITRWRPWSNYSL